jgi:hypothetical protein
MTWLSVSCTTRAVFPNRAATTSTVMNPADAELLDLSNHASDGLHSVMNVAAEGTTTAWGLRLIVTSQIAAGTGLVANLGDSTVLFVREAPASSSTL